MKNSLDIMFRIDIVFDCTLLYSYCYISIGFAACRLSMCFTLTLRKARSKPDLRDATIAAKLRKEFKPIARRGRRGSFASITDPRSFFYGELAAGERVECEIKGRRGGGGTY